MKFILIIIMLLITSFSFSQTETKEYYYKITSDQQDGFGYQIFEGKKLIIDQPFIPALEEKKMFRTEKDAIKIARLVIIKLNNGVFPPTISKEEVDLSLSTK